MSKIPTTSSLRIIPRESDFLDRRIGSRGEIYYDRDANTLRLYNGVALGGFKIAKTDLANVSNETFLAKAIASGVGSVGGGGSLNFSIAADDSTQIPIESGNLIKFVGSDGISTASSADGEISITNTAVSFSNVLVQDQATVSAVTLEDSLTLIAGSNVTITTNTGAKSVTINSTAASDTNSFQTISVATQSDVIADSSTDTLTLVAGSGISITTNPTTDTITITNSISTLSFSQLSDALSSSYTIDKVYLPAITMLTVTNSGASAYRFDQYGTDDNPTIYALNGTTIAFNLTASGHPFLIQTGAGTLYNTGLVHVAIDGTVSLGANAQGKDSGTLYWKIPSAISGGYRYQCANHAPMVGSISIKAFATI